MQSELDQKLERTGISLDQIVDPVGHETADNSLVQPNDSLNDKVEPASEIRVANSEASDQPSDSPNDGVPGTSRGFFFNSESGAIGNLGESLDPATLAVLGILITLAATFAQLVKGN